MIKFADKRLSVARYLIYILILLMIPLISESQIFIGFSTADSTISIADSKSKPATDVLEQPYSDQNDIPFIDYKPAIIWNLPTDSISDYAYIRRNFTDQLVSVWTHPRRIYPASRIYAIDLEGKHYRAVKVSEQNYVFAEKMVEGEMDLYLYRKIPQVNGWIEFVGHDTTGKIYHNNMIVENQVTKGKQENFGYLYSIGSDTLKPVSASSLQKFSDNHLNETPLAKALAAKFTGKNMNKSRKIAVIALMSVGIIGLAATGGGGASLIFLAGFPAAAVVAFVNRPQTLHWEDMVEIVTEYNKERGGTE